MTAHWTAADYRRDVSDQVADASDAALNELYSDRDDWLDDERPTAAELADDGFDWERERWRGWAS